MNGNNEPRERKLNKIKPRVRIFGPCSATDMEAALDAWMAELWNGENWNDGPQIQMFLTGEQMIAWANWKETIGVVVVDAENNILREETPSGLLVPPAGLKLVT